MPGDPYARIGQMKVGPYIVTFDRMTGDIRDAQRVDGGRAEPRDLDILRQEVARVAGVRPPTFSFGTVYSKGETIGDVSFAEFTKAFSNWIPTPQPETPDQKIEKLQAELKKYADAFTKLNKQACPLATVLRVKGDKTTILFSGKQVEVETPDGECRPGRTVKITADTMQILQIIDDDLPAGEVVDVTMVSRPGVCEIDRAGTSRAVAFSGTVEEGDRVVLDSSGSVVTANLGKPKNDCTFGAATGVTWDNIGGLEEAKRLMREAVEAPTKHAGLFTRYGKRSMRGVLLYGPPGCGKTMLGKAAATALAEVHGASAAGAFYYVKGPELLNMYVGQTETNVRQLFDGARRHKKQHGFPAVLFIDEADAILGRRGAFAFGLERTIVPQFLAEMDGLEETGALVIIATNMPSTLDPAIIRDGRIDRRIRVSRPNEADSRAILVKHFRDKPLAADPAEFAALVAKDVFDKSRILFRIKKHSSVNEGVPMTMAAIVNGALLAGIVDRATSNAIDREIAQGAEASVTPEDLHAAVDDAMLTMSDVNLEDDINEFCDGWKHEVCEVRKVVGRKPAVQANAN